MNQQAKLNEESATIFDTKLLMISSALFLGLLGVAGSFFPGEILGLYATDVNTMSTLFIKITGALYLSFAVLNWMARGNIIGGIYSRPVAMGNFFHFTLVGVTLLKLSVTGEPKILFITGATLYSVFAISFGYILFAGGKSCG